MLKVEASFYCQTNDPPAQVFSKSPGDFQGGHRAFTRGPQEESSFENSIYFWDEIDKIRDSYEVMTLFLVFA